MSDLPLGVFDSGLGGLTVVRALRDTFPNERIVYLGDNARVPYGTRSRETVMRYAEGCSRVLLRRGVKALIVACNTVSAVALDFLRGAFDLPVLGVVEPGARAALAALPGLELPASARVKIGVLGTAGTVSSGAYPRAVQQLGSQHEVVAQPAPLLVPLVEEGWIEGEVPRLVVRQYVTPLIAAGASVIVLGCTHYPLLAPLIADEAARLAGHRVPVVDSAAATAEAVRAWFAEQRVPRSNQIAPGALELLVTDRPQSFAVVAQRFLREPLPAVELIDLPTSDSPSR